jgi:hypothetical protein
LYIGEDIGYSDYVSVVLLALSWRVAAQWASFQKDHFSLASGNGILGFDSVLSGWRMLMFRRNIPPPSLGFKCGGTGIG